MAVNDLVFIYKEQTNLLHLIIYTFCMTLGSLEGLGLSTSDPYPSQMIQLGFDHFAVCIPAATT